MDKFIRAKHSFNGGDLITILPGLRQLSREKGKKVKIYQRINFAAWYYDNQINSTVDQEGTSVCINEKMFSMLKPLIDAQDYIESFEAWEGQEIDLDYDLTRDTKSCPIPAGLIHSWAEAVFPQTACDLSEAWIKVESQSIKRDYYKDKVLVNRTQRYTNPYICYFFLKDHEKNIIFSGTETEHSEFCKQWKLDIERLEIDNFYQLAQTISWCKFGVYNQSLNFHIADAMKATRILELNAVFPNTFVTGASGYQFYRQAALEFNFNKLLNE